MKTSTFIIFLAFAIIYALSLIGFIFFAHEDTVVRNWILPIAFFGSGIIIAAIVFRHEYLRYKAKAW